MACQFQQQYEVRLFRAQGVCKVGWREWHMEGAVGKKIEKRKNNNGKGCEWQVSGFCSLISTWEATRSFYTG